MALSGISNNFFKNINFGSSQGQSNPSSVPGGLNVQHTGGISGQPGVSSVGSGAQKWSNDALKGVSQVNGELSPSFGSEGMYVNGGVAGRKLNIMS